MAGNSRFVIWAHRGPESIFHAATNPVVRNGTLLVFEDERSARVECDRLNAHLREPHVRYSFKEVSQRASQGAR